MSRTKKILKRKSKYMQTMIERYGEEEAYRMILERNMKASKKAAEVSAHKRGFAVTGNASLMAKKRWEAEKGQSK